MSAFADRLDEEGRSTELIRRAVRSLGGIFKEARRRGLASIPQPTTSTLTFPKRRLTPRRTHQGRTAGNHCRSRRPIASVDPGRNILWIRASELRGLRWGMSISKIGKSRYGAGRRHKPDWQAEIQDRLSVNPNAVHGRQHAPWMAAQLPEGELGLVFPSGAAVWNGTATSPSPAYIPTWCVRGIVVLIE